MKTYDYIVVGSGCSGAMAAQTLVEKGANVTMLDVGMQDTNPANAVPDKDFLTLRHSDPEQYRYFVGEKAENLTIGELGKGAQLTPPRQYMLAGTDKYIPLASDTFSPLESLGYGGLGIGWGLQCWEYSTADLQKAGLPNKLSAAYEVVSKRIGISATSDEARDYTIGNLQAFQPSAKMDRNHQLLARNYQKQKQKFQKQGLFVGRTPLALITENLGHRQSYQYHDMDFYSDNDLSAWRPWITVNELKKQPNFTYIGDKLVLRFEEKGATTIVHCLDTKTQQAVSFGCKKLILASGALGTARIVLRSLGTTNTRLPFLCNPHSYIPLIQPALMGKGAEEHKLGLGELSYFIDPDNTDSGLSVASSYGYQSLMMFRLISQLPLDFRTSRSLLQYLMPSFVIMIVQHPDSPSNAKYLQLSEDANMPTGDKLLAHYELTTQEEALWDKREKQYVKAMRQLHAYAIKRVKTEHGSSVHYAGTLPFSQTEKPLSLSPEGRLHSTRNVYVADSSGFNYLPAKGLTFTLMANAHLVAENSLNHGKN